MRICLIAVEIFAWGKHGGFGRATRTIGRELARQGIEVVAVVPRRKGQRRIERLDGITVLGFSPWMPWNARRFFRQCNADIYHSCEPSLGTFLAVKAMPQRKHMVTFRDPRDRRDWLLELARPSLHRSQVVLNYLYESNILVRNCIKRLDAVCTTGNYLVPKVEAMYRPGVATRFLPTPVDVPTDDHLTKSSAPTVCYMARLDRRKRPELFLDLAARFPHVRFVAAGKSRDREYERHLRRTHAHLTNLQMIGFVDPFASSRHSDLLARSWIMVNTATREAMPNAFLEAAAHKCAILSHVDPDGFASRFGYHALHDDFADGLAKLLRNNRWRRAGEAAWRHVHQVFRTEVAIRKHIEIYRELLSGERGGSQGVSAAARNRLPLGGPPCDTDEGGTGV